MKIKFVFLFLFLSILTNAQNRNSIWCFGDSAGIDWTNPQQPQFFKSAFKGRGTSVSIGDKNGLLQFYAQTLYIPQWQLGQGPLGVVFNSTHQLMHNGDSIIGEAWYHEMAIVPDPGDTNLYYLFSIPSSGSGTGIFSSIIDMSLNSGLGSVIQKNSNLYFSGGGYVMTDCLTAIKHGNGRDWWLICRPSGFSALGPNNYFISYLIVPGGIIGPFVQGIGNLNNTDLGQLLFNSNGSKSVFQNINGLIDYFDFDRCTGLFSNHINIKAVSTTNPFPVFGSAISPNDSLLYISTDNVSPDLYQYDLSSSNILSTELYIGSLTSTGSGSALQGKLQLAPDGKIYWSSMWSDGTFFFPYPDTVYNLYNTHLSVINQPNNIGTACDFQPFSFYLGGARTYYGLPNNPNYDLGPLVGSICDTLTIGLTEQHGVQKALLVYPNPCSNKFSLTISNQNEPIFESIILTNTFGEEVLSFKNNTHQSNIYDITELPDGLYIVKASTNHESLTCKLLKHNKN